ncbi:outer membrane protein assembly factor BamC [Alteromonas pelagimontana]|uniref:Outer membrane protein assembly factor BamC n=1 Tax=Alteromonas pelagimontana TaxID=1858656 RepID=A0A6M4M889_9ALTE|nr:outer membrane protein assembly factor BamC [Alteromonas pelagimontana]QJR79367.1 outer membrane protein assembly factor BamC [Alteromonas pelagimontana]
MKKSLALISGLTILALTGCASQQERRTASGNYDYLKSTQRATIKIPADVDQPEFSEEYELPKLGEKVNENLIGRELLVSSPALVLPLVSGSHVEEGSREATVWFDQVDDSKPLKQAIWDSLLSFLEQQKIEVDSFDPEAGILITDWVVENKDEDSSWYEFSAPKKGEVKRRFEFSMEVKPHGRTASLHAELKDFQANGEAKTAAQLGEIEERREEVTVLNQFINHYEYQIQLEDSKRIARIRQGLNAEMGFNANGEPAYVVDAQYDVAWPRLLLVLRKLGFDVKDLDKSTGLLFVTYNGIDKGWWSGLFSDEKDLLKKDDYRLKVGNMGEKTSITFMNDESEPFEVDVVTEMYEPFSKVMSQDDLDI